jgi:hypothetical protein
MLLGIILKPRAMKIRRGSALMREPFRGGIELL